MRGRIRSPLGASRSHRQGPPEHAWLVCSRRKLQNAHSLPRHRRGDGRRWSCQPHRRVSVYGELVPKPNVLRFPRFRTPWTSEAERRLQAKNYIIRLLDSTGLIDVLEIRAQIKPISRMDRIVKLGYIFRALDRNRPEACVIFQFFAFTDATIDVSATEGKGDIVLRPEIERASIFDPHCNLIVERGGSVIGH